MTEAAVRLRYSDLPDHVTLRVPTPSGFATMKLLAWFDRGAPRDLFDLAALAEADHIDEAAVRLVRSIAGLAPDVATFGRSVPRSVESTWATELGHQTGDLPTAAACFERLSSALDRLEA